MKNHLTVTTPAKHILAEVIDAFCLSTPNFYKAVKLSKLNNSNLFNGKRSNEKLRLIFIRCITENEAKEILNKIPFPYIEEYVGNMELKVFIDTTIIGKIKDWEDTLVPLPVKKGYRLECVTQHFATQYR